MVCYESVYTHAFVQIHSGRNISKTVSGEIKGKNKTHRKYWLKIIHVSIGNKLSTMDVNTLLKKSYSVNKNIQDLFVRLKVLLGLQLVSEEENQAART